MTDLFALNLFMLKVAGEGTGRGQYGKPSGGGVQVGDIELNEASALPVTLKEARKALGRDMLERALKTHGGKVTAAAKELGISAPDLLRTDGEAGHRQGWLKVRRGFGVLCGRGGCHR